MKILKRTFHHQRCAMKKTGIMVTVMLFVVMTGNPYTIAAGDDTLNAVVRIRSVFPANVDSTDTLGRERAGNGVVIDTEGTILTLAFLTRDAETIEVTVPDKEPVAATLIGHDFNTGFSLLRTNKPLGVTPVKLGKVFGPRSRRFDHCRWCRRRRKSANGKGRHSQGVCRFMGILP